MTIELNLTNLADLIMLLDHARGACTQAGESTWAARAERYRDRFFLALAQEDQGWAEALAKATNNVLLTSNHSSASPKGQT